ncbi:dihydropteroate synthase [Haloarculaceae archaeon H-GB2-1]|nr:dihydropteroate synthase [Haloarculaceae archaeon H-GB1-1]MEA5407262.1 dihydropteroate synthase [Haloarculaceae archaeon H-GB2-1]
MQYHEAVNLLNELPHSRPVLGTETTASMLESLSWTPEDVDFVQVAGSNGKGSTARMLESVLREAGLDVGLYTSPDLNDVRERIRVNGRKVPKSAIRSLVDSLSPHLDDLRAADDEPTYFEVLTALALAHFSERDVDVAVLEVGIGGRYDATSVVDPVASAVTSVSLEHTALLGDTVAEIARDKASVAPEGAPLVTGATGDALATLAEVADLVTVGTAAEDPDVCVSEEGLASRTEATVTIDGPDFHVETRSPLLGEHQARNAGVAAALARQVASVTETDVARGIRKAHWPGRFEIVGQDPLVVLDGAHNPGAVETLSHLLSRYDYDDLHVVIGSMADKDHDAMATVFPETDSLLVTAPGLDRAADPDALAASFASVDAETETVPSVLGATDRALSRADPDDCVLVTGSLSTVAEARDRWTRPYVTKAVDSLAEARDALITSDVPETAAAATSEFGVHRTLKTYVRKRQLDGLKDAATDAGVTIASTGVTDAGVHHDVVLSGTLLAFRHLTDALSEMDDGLGNLAAGIRDALDIGEAPAPSYPWGEGTAVMGILNVTPDSFHDGGEFDEVEAAVERAREMIRNGADIVDVGGESTRPGADPVPPEEERDRVVPVVEELAALDVPVSIDTRKAEVARAALEAGADVVNDVSGFEDPELPQVAAEFDVPVVVMHSLSTPVDPDRRVDYDDVVEDVLDELTERVLVAERAGLDREQIVVDPGLGFGKSPAEDFELVDRLGEFQALGCPVLVGHSHKSMFGHVDCEPGDRLPPTLAVTTMAAERGVDLVRVHDVQENAAAVRAVEATTDRP